MGFYCDECIAKNVMAGKVKPVGHYYPIDYRLDHLDYRFSRDTTCNMCGRHTEKNQGFYEHIGMDELLDNQDPTIAAQR